jgi:hypothetical protein
LEVFSSAICGLLSTGEIRFGVLIKYLQHLN